MDISAWEAHGYCFLWDPFTLVGFILTDSVIALSYVALWFGLNVVRYYIINPDEYKVRPDQRVVTYALSSFGMFIFWCGMSHVMEIDVIFRPDYDIEVLVKALTAIFSGSTAYWLLRISYAVEQQRKQRKLESIE